MCNFFSFLTDGNRKLYYFSADQRRDRVAFRDGQSVPSYDSHTSIARYYGLHEDDWSKAEYNPFTDKLTIDQQHTTWDEDKVRRVLDHLHPTGIPYLDMCLYYGYFPSTSSRFCTGLIKLDTIKQYSTGPAIADAIAAGGSARDVIQWVGIRRDESPARANALEWDVDHLGNRVYRPLVDWTKQQCFDMLKKHNVDPNPLYKLGLSRVGCMPCINARKAEIMEIAKRWPEHVDKIRAWEHLVGMCSKRGIKTFFWRIKYPERMMTAPPSTRWWSGRRQAEAACSTAWTP